MSERLIDRLSMEQIEAILDTLPIEFIFVDDEDRLQYYNKGENRSRPGNPELLGQNVRKAHKPESLPRTNKMIEDLKSGKKDEDEFWIDGLGMKILNRFFAVRNKDGKYLGILEYLHIFNEFEQMAEAKKDAYTRMVVPDPE